MKEIISGIYCIENLLDCKRYIGCSKNIGYRWDKHKLYLNKGNHNNKYLQRVWKKYGEINFKFFIIEICQEEDLQEKEIYYIDLYNSFFKNGKGYNLTLGGDGVNGFSHSDETKIMLSKLNMGKPSPMIGRKHTEKSKNTMSSSQMGNTNSKGKPRSEQSKKNISNGHLGQIAWNKNIKNNNSSSKYFGISISEKHRDIKTYIYWSATIRDTKGKQKYIGQCKEEADAAKLYDRYVIDNNLNLPLNFPNNN